MTLHEPDPYSIILYTSLPLYRYDSHRQRRRESTRKGWCKKKWSMGYYSTWSSLLRCNHFPQYLIKCYRVFITIVLIAVLINVANSNTYTGQNGVFEEFLRNLESKL